MINQDRVREMTRLSILESGVGERELKISTYRRSDYVIFEMVKGFFFGTICFCTVLPLQFTGIRCVGSDAICICIFCTD